MMLLASGVNFGFRRTIPHMLGIGCGFSTMTALIGLGLGQVFVLYPAAFTAMKIVGTLYMLWLAWKIATAGPVGDGTSRGQPMTFLEAAAFQWVNPKAWMMAVTAVATYVLIDHPVLNALLLAAVFGAVNLPCVSVWALFGTGLKGWLQAPRRLRVFNGLMAASLVASLWPIIAG